MAWASGRRGAPAGPSAAARPQPSAARSAQPGAPARGAAPARQQQATVSTDEDGEYTLEMRNFPGSWVAPDNFQQLDAKIKHLLEKFGKLREAPTITGSGSSVVASATFLDRQSAERAALTLHGVDSRTEAEKRAVNKRPPTDREKFDVKMVQRRRKLRPGEKTCRLALSPLPSSWIDQDIQEMCNEYGGVHSVESDGPCRFVVTFASPGAAENAANSLSGLSLEDGTGSVSRLQCELLPQDDAAPPRTAAEPAVDR
ncbi:unnamed protein product, partial [Prorocentrum cordatum]